MNYNTCNPVLIAKKIIKLADINNQKQIIRQEEYKNGLY